MDIEEIAVQRVKREILKYDCLKDYINTNDKTPMWDGEIFIYKENSKYKANEDFKGKISVQIKGHKVNKIKSGKSKYSMNIEYLRAYQKDRKGVLLFVVEMIDSENTQIYYSNLLPVDLKEILGRVKENQKAVSIDIRPIKEKSASSMKMICLNFLKNSNEQMNIEIKNIDEIDKINNIEFAVIGEEKYIEDYLFNNDIYSYAFDETTNKKYALPKLKEIQKYQNKKIDVKINNKLYYSQITIVKNREEEYVLYGKSTKIYLYKNKVNFKLKGNLYERINDAKFIIDLLENRKIIVNNKEVSLPINIGKFQKEKYIESLNKDLNYFNKIKKVFEKFNIKFEKDFDTLDEKSLINLQRFTRLNDGILFDGIEKSGINFIEIAGYYIAFFVSVDSNKKVEVYNYFDDLSEKIRVFYLDKEKNQIAISPYINLTAENLILFSNVNIDIMKQSFEAPEYSEETCLRYNLWLLELIKAYDKSHDQRWLEFAEYLIDKILKFNKSPSYKINKLQIIKRKRNLNQKEKDELYEMKEKEGEDMIQCGIAILLDNLSDFERYFNKLENKEEFEKFPIYNLIKDRRD